jgi:hypothetical protein
LAWRSFFLALDLLDEFDQFQQTAKIQDRGLDAQVLEGGWGRLVGPLEQNSETAICRTPQAQPINAGNPPDLQNR